MHQLTNKQIILGVSGGIAAYKSAELVRRLLEYNAQVRVVMTKAAQEFITPLTLQALSGNPVHTDLLDPEAEAAMGHIELARWADLILIAPATADCLARLATGQADDLLTAVCLATTAPIALAPAMNQVMWQNVQTQSNCDTLATQGFKVFGPGSGSQACGEVGLGRMLEPDELASLTAKLFPTGKLMGLNVVVTAGPTREAIDPVRYISNHSSGKMGFALAQAALDAGARVTLIAGPVNLATPVGAQRIDVISAKDMYDAALEVGPHCELFIACAAVADYRPANIASQKIKKKTDEMSIGLTRNPDIVAAIAQLANKPFTVGFAAETEHMDSHAKDKLQRKGLDLIVANDVANTDIGFNSDENAVTLFWPNASKPIAQTSKRELARLLIDEICSLIKPQNKTD